MSDHEKFLSALAEALDKDANDLTMDTTLEQLEWDSLAVISTIAVVDECFGVVINGSMIQDCKTISDIVFQIRPSWSNNRYHIAVSPSPSTGITSSVKE